MKDLIIRIRSTVPCMEILILDTKNTMEPLIKCTVPCREAVLIPGVNYLH